MNVGALQTYLESFFCRGRTAASAAAINVGRISPVPSLPRCPSAKYNLLNNGYRRS